MRSPGPSSRAAPRFSCAAALTTSRPSSRASLRAERRALATLHRPLARVGSLVRSTKVVVYAHFGPEVVGDTAGTADGEAVQRLIFKPFYEGWAAEAPAGSQLEGDQAGWDQQDGVDDHWASASAACGRPKTPQLVPADVHRRVQI